MNPVLRYRKRPLWMLLGVVLASALWVLNVEVRYQRNARHVPTQFRLRTHDRPTIGKRRNGLHAFQDHGDALADADAHGAQGIASASTLQLQYCSGD